MRTFPLTGSASLDPFLERAGDARVVMLGEASHGTHEYYTWRSAITKRLIAEKKFNFIAVEGDWPDCYRINRFIKAYPGEPERTEDVLKAFNRWPTWMWANWEMVSLTGWLRQYNSGKSQAEKAGFYGLDVYSLWESMETILEYLKKNDPPTARIARTALDCFSGYGRSEQQYAVSSLSASCREEVANLLREVRMKAPNYKDDPEASLNMTQNAFVAVDAEKYYSNMVMFDDKTWNIRDTHMMDTLERLLSFHGANSKGIVWAHNTHIGDARHTSMAQHDLINIGQLCRQRLEADSTVLAGFGSYGGSVIAAGAWGEELKEMKLHHARKGSLEEILHSESEQDRMLIFEGNEDRFSRSLPHRAVGVVFEPADERHNYVPSVVNSRYDVFFYLDQTKALHPLHVKADISKIPDTYPFEF